MAHPHAEEARRQQADRLHRVVGRKSGGSVTKNEVKAMIHKHEAHDHKGEARTKLARGGVASGGKPAHRGDKKSRGKTNVNIVIAHPGGMAGNPSQSQRPIPVPVPVRAPVAPPPAGAAPPVRPPMAGPGGMGPMKRGGRAKHARGGAVKMAAGGGSGLGRLKKAGIKAVSAP